LILSEIKKILEMLENIPPFFITLRIKNWYFLNLVGAECGLFYSIGLILSLIKKYYKGH